MTLHILLTPELQESMPESCQIIADFGNLMVRFPDGSLSGLHCFIEGPEEEIVKWLSPFDGIPMGDGNPMFETFEIVHIKNPIS